jgi:Glutathione S-transferase, N-terminal domain
LRPLPQSAEHTISLTKQRGAIVASSYAGATLMTLCQAPSTAAFVVHWLLIELDLPHERRPIDLEMRELKSPEYLKLNPAGVVPPW